MCVLEKERETEYHSTGAWAFKRLLRYEGAERQSVCVYPHLFIQSFFLSSASLRTIMQGKAPSRLRVVLMVVKGAGSLGQEGHCVGDANRCMNGHTQTQEKQ